MSSSSDVTVVFLQNMISEFKEFEETYLVHLEANNQILPYVLMDELSRAVIDRLRGNLEQGEQLFCKFSHYLEDAMVNSSPELSALIRTSFCESIDSIWQEKELHDWICSRLGPKLRACLLVSPSINLDIE